MRLISSILVIVAIIIGLLLSSCGAGQALGPAITPSPTATKGTSQTPIPDVKIELMKQVDLFLNSEEPYRDNEDLYWTIFRPYQTKNTPKLGLIDAIAMDGTVNLQGVFLGYAETTNGIVLLLGVQDMNGERFVTPLKLYDQKFELYKETSSGFQYLVRTNDYSNFLGEPIILNTKKEVTDFLNTKIGQVFGIQIHLQPGPALSDDDKKAAIETGWSNPELSIKLINDFERNFFEVNKDLSNSLWVPALDDWNIRYGDLTIAQNLQKMGNPSGSAIKITSAEDIDRVLQIEWLPSPDYIMGSSR